MTAPLRHEPPRLPGSVRRTSHIDMHLTDDGLELRGTARDLLTTAQGERVIDQAEIAADLDQLRVLARLDTRPARPLDGLVGRPVGRGFRQALDDVAPDDVHACTALALLLDELPVATVISGYSLLYSGALPPSPGGSATPPVMRADICSGWRLGGTMLAHHAVTGTIPVPLGPPVPPLDDGGDTLAWHHLPPLGPSSMRRRRMVDVTVGSMLQVRAMFRDTHTDAAGTETVLHEYTVDAAVDPATSTFLSCDAIPRVLPWVECPVAAASAWRLAGRQVHEVRSVVRTDLRGTSTCTHLNDLLRSLGDVDVLVAAYHREVT